MCLSMYLCIHLSTCMYLQCMYVCIYVCMYLSIYLYIHLSECLFHVSLFCLFIYLHVYISFTHFLQCGGITVDQFVKWSQADELKLVHVLLQIILEVCHIKMGLRPSSVKEEEAVIRWVWHFIIEF